MTPTTKMALKAAILIALLGFLISRAGVINFATTQNPVVLLVLWYVIFFVFINVSAYWLFHKWDFKTMRVSLGILIIWFAALIAFYWPASLYIVLVSGANPSQVPTPLLATEDDLAFYAWYTLFGTGILALGAAVGAALAGVFAAAVALWSHFTIWRGQRGGGFDMRFTIIFSLGVVVAGTAIAAATLGWLWVEGVLTYAVTPFFLVLLAAYILTPKAFVSAIRQIFHMGVTQ